MDTKKQIDSSFLNDKSILIIESDEVVLKNTIDEFSTIFSIVYSCRDIKEGFELFLNKKDNIDIIFIDLDIPESKGIDFISQIRSKDWEKPIFVSTNFRNLKNLTSSIKLNITDYILKPIQYGSAIKLFNEVLKKLFNQKLIFQQNKELSNFKTVLDTQNMVCETDLRGVITYVNDNYCNATGYSKEELINNNHSKVRDQNTPSSFYENLWATIKSGKKWTGKVKNITKDKETYITKVTILPIFNEEGKIIKYMSSGILVTEDEVEKSRLKKYIISQKSEIVQSEKVLQEKLDVLIEDKIKDFKLESFNKYQKLEDYAKSLEEELNRLRSKEDGKSKQIRHLEKELRERIERYDNSIKTYQEKIDKLQKLSKTSVEKFDLYKKKYEITQEKLNKSQESIKVFQKYIDEYRKKIDDLNDVIASYERTLVRMKKS